MRLPPHKGSNPSFSSKGLIMVWLVQNALFEEESGYLDFTSEIDKTGQIRIEIPYCFWEYTIDMKLAGILPHRIIPFGTVELIKYGLTQGWHIEWNKSFEYSDLLVLGEDFLNNDMIVGPASILEVPSSGKVFIKENAGFNRFKGQVISGYAWKDVLEGYVRKGLSNVEGFTCSSVKNIQEEFRVWVIDNRVISITSYQTGGTLVYKNRDDDEEVASFARKIVDNNYFGMESYTLDIYQTDKGLKVGEINCIHCSGWYAADSKKIVKAILEG
jgi:hypothetical protein